MPLIQSERLLGAQPNAFIHPFRDVVVLDFSFSEVQAVAVGFEYIFVSCYDCAIRGCGIDPRSQRVRVIVSHGWVVLTKRASSRAVAVESRDVTIELNETLAVEAGGLANPAGHKGWSRRRARFGFRSVGLGAGAFIDGGSRTFRVLKQGNLRRDVTIE